VDTHSDFYDNSDNEILDSDSDSDVNVPPSSSRKQLRPSAIVFNPSAWGHLIPSSYCDVGRFCCRVFKF
jgi:hypothetical protein